MEWVGAAKVQAVQVQVRYQINDLIEKETDIPSSLTGPNRNKEDIVISRIVITRVDCRHPWLHSFSEQFSYQLQFIIFIQ